MGKSVTGVSAPAMQAILSFDFPGNVRELENTMERAMALEGSAEITLESLPIGIQRSTGGERSAKAALEEQRQEKENEAYARANAASQSPGVSTSGFPVDLEKIVGDLEKDYILRALTQTGGVKKKAAELLGITFRSLRYRITKYEIHDAEGDTDE